ncbi:NAD-binding protein [Sulfurimonas sp. HSL-1656]|uniref:NAD-binding protein n=1 Tax=Thiomicrolovo subterrani TaxID=3131934 RepID=UPI0031F90030
MTMDAIILFGYNEFAREIAQQLRYTCPRIVVYALNNSDVEQAQAAGLEAHLADLEDNWDDLLSFDLAVTRIICALESEAENVFLTLSLRDRFPDAVIVALATTQENSSKLRLAGANKVIAELQTTANLIIERLEKPVITRLLEALMDTQMELKVAQIVLSEQSSAVGSHINELLESTQRDIIVLAVVDQRMSESFIFTAKGYNHLLNAGDVLVVIGYDKEIKAFEEEVGGVCETDRSHRSG